MKINNDNYKQFTIFILVLVGVSAAIAYLFFAILRFYNIEIPFYIEIPSISGIYALLFSIFDRHVWKWQFFKKTEIIIADDLSGKWIGTARSSHDNFKSDIQAELNIEQSATRIKICGSFDQSKSVSIHENFSRSEVDNKIALFYFFRNEPRYDAPITMAMHEGSAKLTYDKDNQVLEGYYYSGRDRNNYGTIKVKRVNRT